MCDGRAVAIQGGQQDRELPWLASVSQVVHQTRLFERNRPKLGNFLLVFFVPVSHTLERSLRKEVSVVIPTTYQREAGPTDTDTINLKWGVCDKSFRAW